MSSFDSIDPNRRKFLETSAFAISGVVAVGASLVGGIPAEAADAAGPAVVGYSGGKGVTIERVSYPSRNTGTKIAANLFKPAGFDASRKYPAIVVTHPIGGVKEQTAGLYAHKLAEQGFIALAFDASYQGESGGLPRLMELPSVRVEDISSAIDFLDTYPQADADRIGSLGICGGGGYALGSAQFEMRIKAVATVSAADIGSLRREGLGNSRSYEERMKLLADAGEQRAREARGAPIRLAPTVPESDKDFTASTPDLYREGYEYYRTPRGRHPNAPTQAVFSSMPAQMAFFPFDQVEMISPRPLLLIAGARADTLYFSERAYRNAKQPKELFKLPGATHVDMYDKPQFVAPAVAKLTDFFGRHLASTT